MTSAFNAGLHTERNDIERTKRARFKVLNFNIVIQNFSQKEPCVKPCTTALSAQEVLLHAAECDLLAPASTVRR